jgi:hypothetical protein
LKIIEGELQFDFTGAVCVDRLDEQGKPLPQGMALVDIVVEEATRCLLIEIKDPSQKPVPETERIKFANKMQNNELINLELTPKARDSYGFLHLMKRDNHPMIFVVVLGVESVSLDSALLVTFKDRLLRRIRQETDIPWHRQYVKDCVVVKVTDWATCFPEYPMKRVV